MTRVVVIGAGPAGLVAAIRLAEGGARVALLNKGTGGLQLGQGTFDILGYGPDRVERPLDALAGFAEAHPGHPYGVLPADLVARSANYLRDLVGPALRLGGTQAGIGIHIQRLGDFVRLGQAGIDVVKQAFLRLHACGLIICVINHNGLLDIAAE